MDFFSERCLHSDGDVIEKRCCNICLQNEVERLKAENESLKERLEDVYLKDTGKTREINILTKENRGLREALERFKHYHVSNDRDDTCASCGLDLRNEVHRREALKD